MLFRVLPILIILTSCQGEQQEIKQEPVITESKTKLVESQIELIGQANTIASDWEAYQNFLISLDNSDLISSPNLKLSENIVLMSEQLPEQFESPAVRARLLALETHVKKFESFLGHTQKNDSIGKLRYANLVVALDNLKLQVMEKLEREKVQAEIDEFMRQQLKDSTLLPFGFPGIQEDSSKPDKLIEPIDKAKQINPKLLKKIK